jgi:uncharacterized protein YkwD
MAESDAMRTPTLVAALLTAALAVPVAAAQASSAPDRSAAPSPRAAAIHLRPGTWEGKVVALTNARRKAHGVKPLEAASCPRRFAAPWARHLARTGDLVHHLPLTPLFNCVKRPHAAGENIAEGYETPRAVVRAWMSDKGHRDNLLNPAFTRIAVAGARSGRGPAFAVQDFVG